MARKREDPATVGDLEDLAEATRKGFGEALKEALGSVIPSPAPKGDDDSSSDDDSGSDDSDSGGSGAGDWGFKGRWWGTGK